MNNFYKDKKNIIAWLKKYKIKGYILIPDEKYGFVVNVGSDVELTAKSLNFIPVKFSTVKGNFYCHSNKLTSLEFCPQEVGGNFYCGDNKLTSLEFCPQAVGRNFSCNGNKLTSLEFCPADVKETFYCNNNELNSLEFCPGYVGGSFVCNKNRSLGEIQKITDFGKIYSIHKKLVFAGQLSNLLNDNETNKKQNKIKL